MSSRGRGRLVRVDVDVDPASPFAAWLRPGKHFGVEILRATMTVGVPEWRS
jgi:hypothetical protein